MKVIDTTPKPVEKTYTIEGLTEYDIAYIQYCLSYVAAEHPIVAKPVGAAAARFKQQTGINPQYCPEKAFLK